jgi:hypothetical protein
MSRDAQGLLVIAAALSQVKSAYAHRNDSPNKITQLLIAALGGPECPSVRGNP